MDKYVKLRHGKWIWDKNGMDWGIGAWRCSECRARPNTFWNTEKSNPMFKSSSRYCPNCGAKMDNLEGEQNAETYNQ